MNYGPLTPIGPWAFAAAEGYRVEAEQIGAGEYRVFVVEDDRIGFAAAALVPAAKVAIKAGKGAVKLVQRVKESDLQPFDKVASLRARFEQRRAQGGGDVLAIRAPLRLAGVEIGCAGCKCNGGR